jgi:hypothetical protein
MEKEYNFEILFKKLEEIKSEQNNIQDSEMETIASVLKEIEYLKEVCLSDDCSEPVTLTRS